jgi:hypothetical protein
MASKIIVDQLESSGSNITIPTGTGLVVTDGIASSSLPTVPVTKGGTGLTSLGSAGQAVKVNSAGNALEFGAVAGGKILQCISTVKQDTFTATISSTAFTDVTGLSVNITPSATNSKILILCNCTMSMEGVLNRLFIQLKRGGSAISAALGTQVGSNRRQTISIVEQGTTPGGATHSFNFLDSPSSTSQQTYQIALGHGQGASKTINCNKSADDGDEVYIARAASTITALEVSA